MTNMSICGCCGRTTDKNFPFCPWCGKSKIKAADESRETQDVIIRNNLDKKHAEQVEQMEAIGKKIDDLERELSVLVLSAEMAK